MKRFLLFLFAVVLTAQLHAATVVTVNWGAGFDNGFGLSNGTALAVGNEVRLGSFDIPAVEIKLLLDTGRLAELNTHFSLFGTVSIGQAQAGSDLAAVPLNQRGGLFTTATQGALTAGTAGQQMYLWAFKTTTDGLVASDFLNVIETGIFTSSIPDWVFPTEGAVLNTKTIDLTNLTDNGAGSTTLATAGIVFGGFGTGNNPASGAKNFNLAAVTVVPEPTSTGLAIVGGVAMLLRRRRRA